MSFEITTNKPNPEEKAAEYLLQNPFNLDIYKGTEDLQKQLNVLFMNQNNEVCELLQQMDNLESEYAAQEEQLPTFSYSSYPIETLEHPYEYNAGVQTNPSVNLHETDFGEISSTCDESKEKNQLEDAKQQINKYRSQLMFLQQQNTKLLDNHPLQINVPSEASVKQMSNDNMNLKQLLIQTEKITKTNNTTVKDRLLSLLHLKSQQKVELLCKIRELINQTSRSYDEEDDTDNNNDFKENSKNINQKLSLFHYYKLEYDNEIKQLDKEINELKKELDFYIKLEDNNNNNNNSNNNNITENDIKKHIQSFYDKINTYLIRIENDCDGIVNNHENQQKQQQLQYMNKISNNNNNNRNNKKRSQSAPKMKNNNNNNNNNSNLLTPNQSSYSSSSSPAKINNNRILLINNSNPITKSTLLIEKDISNNVHRSITYLRGEIYKQLEILKKECHTYLFNKTMEMEQRIRNINNEKIKLQASNIIETERKQKVVNEKLVNLKKVFYKKYKDEVMKQIKRLESEQNAYRSCINNILENTNTNPATIEKLALLYNQQQKKYDMIVNRLELKEELDKSYELQYEESNKEFERCINQQNIKIKELEKSYQNTLKSYNNKSTDVDINDAYKYEGKNQEILNVIDFYENKIKKIESFYIQKCDKLIEMLRDEGVKVDRNSFIGRYTADAPNTQKTHQPVIFKAKSRSNSNLKKHGLMTKPILLT